MPPPTYPVEGITYSPPRPSSRLPQPATVIPRFQDIGPYPAPQIYSTPQKSPSRFRGATTPAFQMIDGFDLDMVSPPMMDDELWDEEEEAQPAPSPKSPPLDAAGFRRHVESAYAPQYDPRAEAFGGPSRDQRGTQRAPKLPFAIREGDEAQPYISPSQQLIDYDACFPCGDTSYMGGEMITPGQRAPRKRRYPMKKKIKHKIDFDPEIEESMRKRGLPTEYIEEVIEQPYVEPGIFDMPLPDELPRPLRPSNLFGIEDPSPLRMRPLSPLKYDERLIRRMPPDMMSGPLHPDLQQLDEGAPIDMYFPQDEYMFTGAITDEGFMEPDLAYLDETPDQETQEYLDLYQVPEVLKRSHLTTPPPRTPPPSLGGSPCYTAQGAPPMRTPFEYDEGIFEGLDDTDTEMQQLLEQAEQMIYEEERAAQQMAEQEQMIMPELPPRPPSPPMTPRRVPSPCAQRVSPVKSPWEQYPDSPRTPPRMIVTKASPTPPSPKEMLFAPEDMPQLGSPPPDEYEGVNLFEEEMPEFSPVASPTEFRRRLRKHPRPYDDDEELAHLLPTTPSAGDFRTPEFKFCRRIPSPSRKGAETPFDYEYNKWLKQKRQEEIRRQQHLRQQFPISPESPGPGEDWLETVQQHQVPDQFFDPYRHGRKRQVLVGPLVGPNLRGAQRPIPRFSHPPDLRQFDEREEYLAPAPRFAAAAPKSRKKKEPEQPRSRAEMLKEARDKYKDMHRPKSKKKRERGVSSSTSGTLETSTSEGEEQGCGVSCPSSRSSKLDKKSSAAQKRAGKDARRPLSSRIFERQPGPGARIQPQPAPEPEPIFDRRAEQARKQMELEARARGISLEQYAQQMRPRETQPRGPCSGGRQIGERVGALKSLKPPRINPGRSGSSSGTRPIQTISGRQLGERPPPPPSLRGPRIAPMRRMRTDQEYATPQPDSSAGCEGGCGSSRKLGERPPPPKSLRPPKLDPMARRR